MRWLETLDRRWLFLTVGVALFAVAALITLRLSRADASLMLVLFSAQFVLPIGATRLVMGVVFSTLAVDILISQRRQLRPLLRALRQTDEPNPP